MSSPWAVSILATVTKIRSRDDSHVQDRRGQGGGGGGVSFPGLGGGGGGLPFPTKAGGGLLGIIVLLAAVFLPKLLGGQSAVDTGNDNSIEAGGGEACQTDLEQTLCGAERSAQTFWTEQLPASFNTEYRVTDMVFFSGGTNTGCGAASSQTGPFYCPVDEFVYFDLEFLQQLQEQFEAQGDLAAQYIVAHEFGHHVQNVLGTSGQVQQQEQANPDLANEYSVALELQADCYAGVWANSEKDRFDSPGEIEEAINAAEAVGDDRIQQRTEGRIDPESFTHGTSAQRAMWFRQGFSTGDPRRCNTFAEMSLG